MGTQLLVCYDFPPIGGGIARMLGELARRYPPGSLVVSTGQYRGSGEADAKLPQRVDRLAISARRLRTIPGLVRWCPRVASLARSTAAEFTWCGNFKPAGYPAKWTRHAVGTPYGIMLYGTDLLLLRSRLQRSAVKRRAAQSLLGSAAVLLTISRYTRDLCLSVLEELGLEGTANLQVVPLGTDHRQFRPGLDTSSVRARYGLEQGRWLLTVARLVAHKGIDTVIRVLAELQEDYADLRYLVVGSGPQLGALQELARRLGVAERVRFLTDVPDQDLPALYNHAELYLGLSRPVELMVEGFGISLCEASASGIPVIGGSAGGIPDAVRHGETGLLLDPERLGPIIDAVRLLLRDQELARRLGAGGRRAVETFYNWDRVTDQVIAIGREHAGQTGTALQSPGQVSW